ncbi:Response regulator PleD [Fundidesulfovibrio magnetotacticus]|uniref:diguanylate cyclase n=1 Tax=Fundidesulfovibrio magnetotacticus TaxID=2730080 RepID=A0A6V8LSE1_9BACT|nr:diguanylate cyclase [Fundidesulfovibrio magnetotacticus]GFK92527.1 Response regulator PleD [Fundidesulfovibrio magnetotacticus]
MPRLSWRAFALLAVLALLLCLAPGPSLAQVYTEVEQDYIRSLGRVTLCVDPDWVPFERINPQGQHEGIAADLVALVGRRAGIEFELTRTKDWDESLDASRQGLCRVLSFLNQTPKREEWLVFTQPLFSDPNVFITREEHAFISDPAGLTGESIVFPKGTAMEERIRRDYPNLRVLVTDTEEEAIAMVSDRKADMTMRSLIVAAYTIKKEGLFNLKIAGQLPGYANQLRMGVAKNDPMLRDVLDRAIRTITPQEREQIVNRHVSINVQTGVSKALIWRVGAGVAALLVLAAVWNWRLRRHNEELTRRSLTDTLTGLPNRLKMNEQFARELERARRYARPLSIVMLDLDSFKSVNDDLGHLMGDRVLVAVARAAQNSLRGTDMLGRWGGEEFLILCPETGPQEALVVAERVRLAVKGSAFESGRPQTVSAGVASVREADSADDLLHRADKALYEAKRAGRDRVCQG